MKKKRRKSLISLLCVITMLVGLFSGIPFGISEVEAGTGTSYTELTFSDWGYDDGDVKDAYYKNPQVSLTDMSNVAFTGNVTFRYNEDRDWLRIGAKDNSNGIVIRMRDDDTLGHQMILSYWNSEGAEQYVFLNNADYGLAHGTSFKLRMTFDKTGSDYKVNTWINDTSISKEMTVPDSKLGIQLGVQGVGDNPTTIESVVVEKVYQELTFSDWGYDDGDIKDAYYKDSQVGLTDMSNVAFTGNVTFRYNEDRDWLRIGAKDNSNGIVIRMRDDDTLGHQMILSYWNSEGAEQYVFLNNADYGLAHGTSFKLRMTFDKVGSDYRVNTWINDTSINKEMTVPDSKLGTKLGIQGVGDNPTTIESVVVEKVYQELTFSDWGYDDGDIKDAYYKDSQVGLKDMSNVAFTGNVTFRYYEDCDWLRIGAIDSNVNNGIRLCMRDDDSLGHQLILLYWNSEGAEQYVFLNNADYGLAHGTSFKLRMTFDKAGSGYRVNTWINDTAINKEITVPISKMGTKLGVQGVGDNPTTVQSVTVSEEPEPAPEIQTITFSDYGIADGQYSDGLGTRGTIGKLSTSPTNLDGYVFKGNVKFGTTGAPWIRFLTIGTTATEVNTGTYDTDDGVVIRQEANGNIIFYTKATGEGNPVTFEGFQAEEKIAIEVGFAYQEDGSIVVSAKAGNNEAKELVLPAGTSLGTNLFVRADVLVEVESYAEEEPEEPDLPIAWQDISFSDFGIADGTYSDAAGSRGKIGLFTQAAENLHGYVLKGEVKFNSAASNFWCNFIKIGTTATTVNTASYDVSDGIQIVQITENGTDGILKFACSTSEGEKAVQFTGFEYNTYIPIQMSFEYKKDDSIVVTVAAGEQEAKELVLPAGTTLGTNLFIRADQGVSVRKGIQFVDAKQSLEDAGYQRLTIGDFGMYPGKYEPSSEIYKGEYTDEATLDKTYLDMNLTIDNPTALDTYIRYGGTTWSGIHIGKSGELLDIGEAYGRLSVKVAADTVGLTDFDGANVKIALDRSGTVYTVTIYVNNVLVVDNKTVDLENADEIGNYLGIYVKDTDGSVTSTNSITITADATEITKAPASYNLEQGNGGGYLITGTLESVKLGGTEVKDNTAYVKDRAIICPGDYTVQTYAELKSIRATQNITLYILGDVNCDGQFTDADKTALEGMVSGTGTIIAATAAQKAADLDNDGKVGSKDLRLMKEILGKADAEAARKDVIKKYYPATLTYDFLGGDDVMPIGGMHGPIDSTMTLEYFLKLKACGINMINNSIDIGGGTTTVQKSLKLAQDAGIGYFVSDYRLNAKLVPDGSGGTTVDSAAETRNATQLATYMGDYGYYDSFLGINVKDEPFYSQSGSINKEDYLLLDHFTDIAAALNKYTNINGFINILPEDSDGVRATFGIGKSYYEDYWTQYKTANPQVYSVDDYPFADRASDTVKSDEIKGYFGSLGKIRKESLANDVAFWFYVQAGGDFEDNESITEARIATEAETYWNVNTALAFGAKGIEYFPLVQPKEMGQASGDRNGLLNKDGTETKFYGWASNINNYIASVDEVLMKSTSKDIVASGGYAQSMTGGELTTYGGPVTEIKTSSGKLSSVASTDTTYGALVGCFDYRDTEAFYVVNYDADSATSATQTVTLTFDDDYYVRVIQRCQAENYTTTTDKTLALTIPSGQAALVVLQSESNLNCSTVNGFSMSDLDADADSTATVAGTTVNESPVNETISGDGSFAQWGEYKVTYFVGGKTYSRNLAMYMPGDVTYDGVNNSKDLVRMKKAATNKLTSELTTLQKLSGDLDGDGSILDADVIKLCSILVGK